MITEAVADENWWNKSNPNFVTHTDTGGRIESQSRAPLLVYLYQAARRQAVSAFAKASCASRSAGAGRLIPCRYFCNCEYPSAGSFGCLWQEWPCSQSQLQICSTYSVSAGNQINGSKKRLKALSENQSHRLQRSAWSTSDLYTSRCTEVLRETHPKIVSDDSGVDAIVDILDWNQLKESSGHLKFAHHPQNNQENS